MIFKRDIIEAVQSIGLDLASQSAKLSALEERLAKLEKAQKPAVQPKGVQ